MAAINLPNNWTPPAPTGQMNFTPTHTQYNAPPPTATPQQTSDMSAGIASGVPQNRTRMPWEAAPGMTANQMSAAGTPNPGASMASSAPPPQTGGFGWNAGANPFQESVTATDMTGGTAQFNPNQYTTPEAAQRLAQMFGANAVSQNTGLLQGGSVSAPMHGLDFGAGDVQDTSWIATALNRGDPMANIMARLQAGIAPPGGMAQRESPEYMGNQWNMNSPISQNLPQGQTSSLAGGQAGIPTGSMFSGVKPATHLGPQGGVQSAALRNGPQQQRSPQQAFGGQMAPEGPGAQQFGWGQGPGVGQYQGGGQQGGFGMFGGNGSSNQALSGFGNGYGNPGYGNHPYAQQQGFGGQQFGGGFNPGQPGNMQGFMQLLNQFLATRGQGQMGPQRQPQLPNRVQNRQFPNSWYYPQFR